MMDRWNLLIFFFFSSFSIFFSLKTHFGWRKHFFDKNVLARTFTVYQKKKKSFSKQENYSDNLPMMDRWNLLIFFFFSSFFDFFSLKTHFGWRKHFFDKNALPRTFTVYQKKKKNFSKQEIIQIIFQWWIDEICWFSSFFSNFSIFFHSKLILVGENTFLTKTFYQEHSQFTKKKKELLKTGDYSDNLPMMDRWNLLIFFFFSNFSIFFHSKLILVGENTFLTKTLYQEHSQFTKKKKSFSKQEIIQIIFQWWIDEICWFSSFFKLFDFFSLKTHFGWRKHFFDKNVLPRTFTVYQKKKELLKTGDYSDNLPMMDRWNLLIFFFFSNFSIFFTQNSFWLEKTLFWQKRFTKNIHSLPKKKRASQNRRLFR